MPDFTTLRTMLSDRGFSRLTTTQLSDLINDARQEMDNYLPWPYRLTSASGTSPLTVSDLGSVEEVITTADLNNPLRYMERELVRAYYGDITVTGTPIVYFIDNGVIRTYPVGGTLTVRYYKRTVDLSANGDTPLAPSNYHRLIVDIAEREAMILKGDKEEALMVQQRVDRKLSLMAADLMQQSLASSLPYPMGAEDS
jgi:hypothetical protein